MGLKVSSDMGGGGGNFERPEPKMTLGVLARYYDLGIQETNWNGNKKEQHKVCFVWELKQRDSKGRQFQQFDTLTLSLFGESKLKRRIEALLGRSLEEHEEDAGIDLDSVVGKCAMLILQKSERGSVFIKDANMLQDATMKLAVEGDYSKTPRYIAKIMGGEAEGGGGMAASTHGTRDMNAEADIAAAEDAEEHDPLPF